METNQSARAAEFRDNLHTAALNMTLGSTTEQSESATLASERHEGGEIVFGWVVDHWIVAKKTPESKAFGLKLDRIAEKLLEASGWSTGREPGEDMERAAVQRYWAGLDRAPRGRS